MKYTTVYRTGLRKWLSVLLASVILAGAVSGTGALATSGNITGTTANPTSDTASDETPGYDDIYQTYPLDKAFPSEPVSLDLSKAAFSNTKEHTTDSYEGVPLFVWNKEQGSLNASFDCKEGLYTIEIQYLCDTDTSADIIRSAKIDGKLPFSEAQNIKLTRVWTTDSSTTFDQMGNERPASLVQKKEMQTGGLTDLYGLYSDPLLFYMTDGNHTLDMEYISGNVSIASIRLVPYTPDKSYEEYLAEHKGASYSGETITVEGENALECSDRTLSATAVNDPAMSPYELGKDRVNAIGGWNWRYGNDWISWNVNVPTDGYYKLALRVNQDYNGLVTYRRIEIDNELPFDELADYPFYSKNGYQTVQLGNDKPYLFYLTAGNHTLTMKAVTGGMTPVINGLQKLSREMSVTVNDIRTITGTNPDPNFNYELEKKLPWLLDTLNDYANKISTYADELEQVCRTKPQIEASILSNADEIRSLIKKPRNIPMKLDDLSQMQASLADYSTTIRYMPLSVDFLQFMNPEEAIKQHTASFWENMQLMFTDFIQTFTQDYSLKNENTNESKSINIWISRGRDWGEIIQKMAEEEFTPKTGIGVKINILPTGSTGVVSGTSPLLLSIVSGNEPDLALGSDMDTPAELAIRGAAKDLKEFNNYDEVASRFSPAAINALSYQDGVYALPETMDIPIMIYRTDILKQLGIGVPNTWDELWTYTLPQLKQINANFYVNSSPDSGANSAKIAMYSTFLYQNGGTYYTQDGYSNLDSDAAFKAFSDWTKSFVQYQSPQSANLYNEMRIGTVPIAIGYLNDYLMLDIAAPELYGRFEIAPIPGTKDDSGNIVRYGAGSVTSAVMFKSSKVQDESWQFLDWWTSDSVQEQFSSEIVAKVGPTARWYSANLNAFFSLPWGAERSKIIEDWLPWYKNPQNTLGGYMTSRSVANAWTRTVMNNMNARDSLEQAFKETQMEITRKHEEYGVK